MTDLIVFSVGSNRYAMNIENIQRIIQAVEYTAIPNSHRLIDGIMSYEKSVIKVLNFRKLIGMPTYEEELNDLFMKLKNTLNEWINELERSLENDMPFSQTIDHHKSKLGTWLDSFNSYDDKVSIVLKDLMDNHKQLYESAAFVLELYKKDKEKALNVFKTGTKVKFNNTVKSLDVFIAELDKVANSLQKLVIYEKNNKNFAIKVDLIEDIAHIEESNIMNSDEEHGEINEFLELRGVLDINGVLINVIKTVHLPK